MRKLIKPENYCQDIDDKQESSVITTNDTEDMYYLEVIKVIGKDNDNNNIYLKFIKQRKKHDRYAIKTIIEGFDYDKLMNHLNYRNNLDSMVCLCNTDEYLTNGCQNKVSPVKTLEYLKDNFNRLKGDGLITSQKDFIMAPVYNGEFNKGHWTVAIIYMFDSTLQQKNTFEIDNKLLKCNETVNAKRQI